MNLYTSSTQSHVNDQVPVLRPYFTLPMVNYNYSVMRKPIDPVPVVWMTDHKRGWGFHIDDFH